MTLEEHAEAIRKAIQAAEEQGMEVEIKDRGIGGHVVIRDPRTGQEEELDVY
jgi:ribosomal protein S5